MVDQTEFCFPWGLSSSGEGKNDSVSSLSAHCSVVSGFFATLWTVARQAPLSMGIPRQEHWRGLPLPFPGDLPDPRIEPAAVAFPVLTVGFFTTAPPGKPQLSRRVPASVILNHKKEKRGRRDN